MASIIYRRAISSLKPLFSAQRLSSSLNFSDPFSTQTLKISKIHRHLSFTTPFKSFSAAAAWFCLSRPEYSSSHDVSTLIEDDQPHYLLKIKQFSMLSESDMERYESDDFEAGGYKWRLCLYPNGNKKRSVSNHISLYLAISDTGSLPRGWEVNAHFKFFVYDHMRDNYLTIQETDGRTRRFHALKTEWGFDELLSLDRFKDTSKGYLFDDSCVIGAEVYAIKYVDKVQCLSMVNPHSNTYTWKIDKFSEIKKESLYSEEFKVGAHTWKLLIYPNGCKEAKGKKLSLFLEVVDDETRPPEWRVYAEYNLGIRDQVSDNHFQKKFNHWFSESSKNWGARRSFALLSDLDDASKGYLVNDTLIVEAEITIMAMTKNLT